MPNLTERGLLRLLTRLPSTALFQPPSDSFYIGENEYGVPVYTIEQKLALRAQNLQLCIIELTIALAMSKDRLSSTRCGDPDHFEVLSICVDNNSRRKLSTNS